MNDRMRIRPCAGRSTDARRRTKYGLSVLAAGVLIAACDSGPSESALLAACLTEGGSGANKSLHRAMGVKPEVLCKCVAAEASQRLTPEARRAMLLDMQGKSGESRAVSAAMSPAEREDFMLGTLGVLEQCLGKPR